MISPLTILFFFIWVGILAFMRRYRIWLIYYLSGTVGFTYWSIFLVGDVFDFKKGLAQSVAWTVHVISNMIGIPTRIFEGAPGILLVLVIAQQIGWTILQVGVESSGILELGVINSLLLFYPGWSPGRKIKMCLIGSAAIWSANVVRMMVIVIMLNRFGKQALVLAHMFVGKALFFLLAVGIFWSVITLPTVKDLHFGYIRKRLAL